MAKKYSLTDEHRAQLKPWADKWIANALSTDPMTDKDRDICRKAIVGLYEAADLDKPERVVFCSSPFVMRFAAGLAEALIEAKPELPREIAVAHPIAGDIIAKGCEAAGAKAPQIRLSEKEPKRDLTRWFVFPSREVKAALTSLLGKDLAAKACDNAVSQWRNWQGGNQWSSWVAYLTFFRYIAKLDIDYSKWDHWEKLAVYSGPRVVTEKFAIISDRPEVLTVDDQNREHNETGPFQAWRDGTAIYAWHGARVPAYVIERPEDINIDSIWAEENAEVRRVMIDRYGKERLLNDKRVVFVDRDEERQAAYYHVDLGDEVTWGMLGLTCHSTGKTTVVWCNPRFKSVKDALAHSYGFKKAGEYAPEVET